MSVPSQNNVTAATSVTPVGTSLGDIFCAVEMTAASPALAGAAEYFYIVYEV